ncbi:hypothetical protein BDZ91DRAFT_22421 [Kalaharituber pfeilii]|nr:hypothetical protein BDZ91DRAFT_22421 [Kalaharituber pfeilii]
MIHMNLPLLIAFLATSAPIARALPSPSEYLSVTVVNILGQHRHAYVIGPGYVPTSLIDKDLRFAFAGTNWDHHCLEAEGGETGNGKLLRVTDNCGWWQNDAIWKWDMHGRITHSESRCVDLDDPETLLDAPELGTLNLVQFWTCDGSPNQQWVALKDSRKIANVAKPGLCLSPVGDKGLVAAVNCKHAKDIGVVVKE